MEYGILKGENASVSRTIRKGYADASTQIYLVDIGSDGTKRGQRVTLAERRWWKVADKAFKKEMHHLQSDRRTCSYIARDPHNSFCNSLKKAQRKAE